VVAFSLVDMMFALALSGTLAGVAVAQTLGSLDDLRAVAAARYVSSRLQQTRIESIVRGHRAALRFDQVPGGYAFRTFVDGNRNGVLSADVQSGVDRPIGPTDALGHRFAGVEFGAIPGLPSVDPAGGPPGTDPIRTGPSDMVTFTPMGTATTGSLYVRGRNNVQLAVRIFGQTGKTRVLKFNSRNQQWNPL
jgi:type II secretory pathway pseudopilin PulG